MSKPQINHNNVMQFQDIPDGAHFRELGENPRTFIKLRLTFATGEPFKVFRVVLGEDDEPKMQDWFNAVDYNGIGGKCPPWVEFEVIPKP